jgi:ABC-type polysaccharide/polyol phosphate export permease
MFPAHLLPSVVVVTNLIHYLFALPVLLALMIATGSPLHLSLLFLPILVALQFVLLIGLTHFFSSINVTFRDIQHLLGNALTLIFFLCPIIYPPSTVPGPFKFTVDWNPLALLTMGYQDVILNGTLPSFRSLGIISVAALAAYLLGTQTYAAKRERFAESL